MRGGATIPQPVDDGGPNARFPFPAYPNGWARVGLGEELAPGDAQPIRYFGRDLVLSRTASGVAQVSGGWETCERNGFVFLWYDGEGRPPDAEVPEIPEHTDPAWSPYVRLRWKIRGRSYDMGENAVDDVHFHYLHGAASLPKTDRGDVRGHQTVRSQMKMQSPRGEVNASIESTNVPGMGLVYLKGICDTLIVMTSTPIDGEYVDQMFSYKQRVDADDPASAAIGRAFLRDLEKQMNEDIVCFEHKRYFVRPLLCDGDGPILDYRRRTRQRYTGEFPRVRDGESWDQRAAPVPRTLSQPKPPGFSPREFDELASFLRSSFRARKVERVDHADRNTVELRLLGREEVLRHVLEFERDCLERSEVSDLRSYLARPLVKQRIGEAGATPFAVPTIEVL